MLDNIREALGSSTLTLVSARADMGAQKIMQDHAGRMKLDVVLERLEVLLSMNEQALQDIATIEEEYVWLKKGEYIRLKKEAGEILESRTIDGVKTGLILPAIIKHGESNED